jgi:hypothetical protein
MLTKHAIGSNTELNSYFEIHKIVSRLAAVLYPCVSRLRNLAVQFGKAFCYYRTVACCYMGLFRYITQLYKHGTRLYLTEGNFSFENEEKTPNRIIEKY